MAERSISTKRSTVCLVCYGTSGPLILRFAGTFPRCSPPSRIHTLALSDAVGKVINLSDILRLLRSDSVRVRDLHIGMMSQSDTDLPFQLDDSTLSLFSRLTRLHVRYDPRVEPASSQSNALPHLLQNAPLDTLHASYMSYENIVKLLQNCGNTIKDLYLHSWDEGYNRQLPSLTALWVKQIPVDSTKRAVHFPSRVETLRFFVDDAPDWHPPRNLPEAMTHLSWCPNMRIILLTRFERRFDVHDQPSPDLSRAIEPQHGMPAKRHPLVLEDRHIR